MRVAFLAPGASTGPVACIRRCAEGWEELWPDEFGFESEDARVGDEWDGEKLVQPPPPPPSKEDLIAYAAGKRWAVETSGIVVNGTVVRTDEKSQAKIAGAVQLLDADPTLTQVDWEAQPGQWVALDAASLRAVGIAVGRHVQAAFSTLRLVQEGIQSETITTYAQIDAAPWPSNT